MSALIAIGYVCIGIAAFLITGRLRRDDDAPDRMWFEVYAFLLWPLLLIIGVFYVLIRALDNLAKKIP